MEHHNNKGQLFSIQDNIETVAENFKSTQNDSDTQIQDLYSNINDSDSKKIFWFI